MFVCETFAPTTIFNHALDAFKAAGLDAVCLVEIIRKAVTSLDVEKHVAINLTVFFHVCWEKSAKKSWKTKMKCYFYIKS